MIRKTKALVAVLNWGLGHATRTIPVIEALILQDNDIVLASDGGAYDMLHDTFPKLKIHKLPGYEVTYPTRSMVWNIASQLPKIIKAITQEQRVVQEIIKTEHIQTIISDNRYGCYGSNTHNILISHQLNLQSPFATHIVNTSHARMINRFDEVWIPDDTNRTLSGSLSNPKWIAPNIKVKAIEAQSRLSRIETPIVYDIAAVLSGPEPQRTYFEKELIPQLKECGLKTILVKGKQSQEVDQKIGQLTIRSFASGMDLSEIICSSRMIICRSGYSTIMDLQKLKKSALYIPTPGQTEQVYLAKRMAQVQKGIYQEQGDIDILQAWERLQEK